MPTGLPENIPEEVFYSRFCFDVINHQQISSCTHTNHHTKLELVAVVKPRLRQDHLATILVEVARTEGHLAAEFAFERLALADTSSDMRQLSAPSLFLR